MIKVESFGVVPFSNEGGIWKVLLILHREGNHWGFPKGRAQPNETPLESAKRELQEETGLVIKQVLIDQPMVEQYQFRRKKQIIVKVVHYFAAFVEGSLHLQQEEVRDAKWLTLPEAIKQLSFREARHILKESLRHLNIQPS